jgi:carbonic anhydrase/acetyltransferase-like protein (isoleucine patch superfamily)
MPSRQHAPDSHSMTKLMSPQKFFDLSDASTADIFENCDYVWEPLKQLHKLIERLVKNLTVVRGTTMAHADVASSQVYIDEDACIEPGVFIKGPCYVGPRVEVRHGAYIRGGVILLRGSVVGHASEVKNSILLPEAKAPHFAYVGDSILGHRVNLGAGTKLSNVAITSTKDSDGQRRPIIVSCDGDQYDTGLSKFGSILGDDCQTGCNSVLNPGCILEPGCLVYPNANVSRGCYTAGTIVKLRQKMVHDERTDKDDFVKRPQARKSGPQRPGTSDRQTDKIRGE